MSGLFDWFLPAHARGDAAKETRYKGVAKALLSISLVVSILFAAYLAERGAMSSLEVVLFLAAIATPAAGAVAMRYLAHATPALVVTNLCGVLIVAVWSFATGGVHSPALPWLLALLAVLSTFGNDRILLLVAAIDFAAVGFLYAATVNGWLPASLVPEDVQSGLQVLSMSSAVAVVALSAILVLRERVRAKALLREARDAAEAASRAKSAFLSSVSHELRTPLHSIIGFAELLKLSGDRALDESQRGHVDRIIEAGEELSGLVAGIIEMSRIEAGGRPMQLQDVSVADLVSHSVSALAADAHRKGIRVQDQSGASASRRVRADPTFALRALKNLLSNAVKFNRQGGRITILCSEPKHGVLRLTVDDTGRGIPAEQQARVFEPFARLAAESGNIRGMGLGLAITKRLVEACQGRVGFRSKEGEGSSFWIELPLARQ